MVEIFRIEQTTTKKEISLIFIEKINKINLNYILIYGNNVNAKKPLKRGFYRFYLQSVQIPVSGSLVGQSIAAPYEVRDSTLLSVVVE
jgi:hypothetical protein